LVVSTPLSNMTRIMTLRIMIKLFLESAKFAANEGN
jgi:hypothetical protein